MYQPHRATHSGHEYANILTNMDRLNARIPVQELSMCIFILFGGCMYFSIKQKTTGMSYYENHDGSMHGMPETVKLPSKQFKSSGGLHYTVI